MTSVIENEEGLYHPKTYVHKGSGDFDPRECGGIVSSLDLSPKVIRRLSSSYCGLQVVDDDDDVPNRKIKVLMMMLLIERSECDHDVVDRKIRV